jgi:hypothetical protein
MNIILTSIYRLEGPAIEPFFESLRLTGSNCSVIVFAMEISPECKALLKRHKAIVIDAEYQGLPMAYAGLSRRIWLAFKAIVQNYWNQWRHGKDTSRLFINCWRFFCFRDYLLQLQEKPEHILLADVRDVVFQSDPFSYPFPKGLSVASEQTRGTIGQSRGNTKWLIEAVGWREMRKLKKLTAICAGTTFADYATMMKYLEAMTTQLDRRFFYALFDSIDQGLHNYFVHNRLVTPLQIHTNWHGPFLTLDSETVLPKNKNAKGYLCNNDGTIIPIVHQYDRIKNLFSQHETRPACWAFNQPK